MRRRKNHTGCLLVIFFTLLVIWLWPRGGDKKELIPSPPQLSPSQQALPSTTTPERRLPPVEGFTTPQPAVKRPSGPLAEPTIDALAVAIREGQAKGLLGKEAVAGQRWFKGGAQPQDSRDVLVQEFPAAAGTEKCAVIWDKQKGARAAYLVQATIWKRYQEMGGPYHKPELPNAAALGAPTQVEAPHRSPQGAEARVAWFEGGAMVAGPDRTILVAGPMAERWKAGGGAESSLGLPVAEAGPVRSSDAGSQSKAWVQAFEGGSLYHVVGVGPGGRTLAILSPTDKAYATAAAESPWLGLPLSEVLPGLGKCRSIDCEGGYLASPDGARWKAYPYETGRIAYVSNQDGNREIYVTDPRGEDQKNLTQNRADDWDPAWSPGGRRVAFVSNRDGNPEIYVMDADGKNPTRVTTNDAEDAHPVWFPDGSRIIWARRVLETRGIWRPTREMRWRFIVMRVSDLTRRETRLDAKDVGLDHEDQRDPAVSPNGQRLAFTIEQEDRPPRIALLNLRDDKVAGLYHLGNELRTRFGQEAFGTPAWHPTGETLVAVMPPATGGPDGEICLTDAVGGRLQKLGVSGSHPAFSPDGTKIVFSVGGQIYILDIAEGVIRLLHTGNGQGESPCWTK